MTDNIDLFNFLFIQTLAQNELGISVIYTRLINQGFSESEILATMTERYPELFIKDVVL